ncbi:caspase family protein [uncultured Parabacteroides sp.]|uniref:caspase family protein n=1 Tax=uncultured Parabacteroides sp. TaxID=512312 RepID=UPI002627F1B9|nr:caspase family protein [uncultured Parabacteroides sp.]
MGWLRLFLIVLCLPLQVLAQKIYVVSVGIADYKEINDLRLTENDVRTFNDLMRKQGANIHTLLGKQATHAATIAALRGSFARAKKEDTMIFFFSGHGYEGGFCCWDMSARSLSLGGSDVIRNAASRDQLAKANRSYGGLSYQEMQILFRNCRAGKKIVIADACFSGGLNKGEQLNISVQSARNSEVIYFMSSHMDETSLEMRDDYNGLFTKYLKKGLSGESDTNGDRKITIKEIYDYVYRSVVDFANKIPHSQHPELWGRYDGAMEIYDLTK